MARKTVSALLAEAGLTDLVDAAELLTSELVTNAVIHARTELELEIEANADGVSVAVTDFQPPSPSVAELTAARGYPQTEDGHPAETGRGLLLVSLLASSWGTIHSGAGRRIWVRLDRAGSGGSPEPGADAGGVDQVLATLLGGGVVQPSTNGTGTPTELLRRLVTALGAGAASVTVDRADGLDSIEFARYASEAPVATSGRVVRAPLPLRTPWCGELTATGVRGRHAEAMATLTAEQIALLIENQRLREAHDETQGWLVFLAQAGELLAQSLDVELTVALIPRLVVPRLGQWCAVHLANEYDELSLAAMTHTDESAEPALSGQLGDALLDLQHALAGDGLVALTAPADSIVLPLGARGERLGTLTIGRHAGRWQGSAEFAIIEDLGRRAALAIDNARIHDHRRRITATLQQSLLPPLIPRIDGLDLAAQYVPAGDGLDVGGDFYDVVPLPHQGWLVVVGDVSGKGVGAAAVTGLVRDVLHALALDYREPLQTLRRLNDTLVERGGGHFCTLALAFLTSVAAGSVELALHLAGHEQPVLLRADGTTSMVGQCGTALGLVDRIEAPRATVRLDSGDALVFYTDGVTERRNGGKLYGHRRLLTEVAALAGLPAAMLASRLCASVLDFSPQPPRDDIAIVALRAP